MDGFLSECVWPASAIFRVNGHTNAKRSDSARRNSHFELEVGLRFPETGFQGQRQLARNPHHAGICLRRDHSTDGKARQFGAFWHKARKSRVRKNAWWRLQSISNLSLHRTSQFTRENTGNIVKNGPFARPRRARKLDI